MIMRTELSQQTYQRVKVLINKFTIQSDLHWRATQSPKLRLRTCGFDSHSLCQFKVTKEELTELMKIKNFCQIGRIFGVSDNAIRKRAKKYGVVD